MDKWKIAVILILILAFGWLGYWYLGSSKQNAKTSEEQEFSDAVKKYNEDNSLFLQLNSDLSSYSNEVMEDGKMTTQELSEIEERMADIINVSDALKKDISNLKKLVSKNEEKFKDPDARIEDLENLERNFDGELNTLVIYIGTIRTELDKGDYHDNIMNDIQNDLIEIRDR